MLTYLNQNANDQEDQGRAIASLVDKASRGLFFTTITVDDDLNAYKVFEALNTRGVKLSAPDLLKNYLFSIISRETPDEKHDKHLDDVERRWSKINDRLQNEKITSYLRKPFGLLLAVKRQVPDAFSKVLKAIVNLTFRYNVIGNMQANEQERVYSKVAVVISEGTYDSAEEIQQALDPVYPRDKAFSAAFTNKILDTKSSRNKQVVRYILAKIDAYFKQLSLGLCKVTCGLATWEFGASN